MSIFVIWGRSDSGVSLEKVAFEDGTIAKEYATSKTDNFTSYKTEELTIARSVEAAKAVIESMKISKAKESGLAKLSVAERKALGL